MRRMLIKELGKVITGNTPSMKNTEFYNSNDIGFVKPDIFENSRITHINSTKSFISEKARNKARIVRKDTVLITCIGSIGKVGIIEDAEYSFNQQINAIEPNDKVVAKYLAYNILSNKNRLMDIANAPVVPIINKTQFENFDIVINENIEEQKRIVKILDQTNRIITLRRNQLNELDKLIKSRFVEMFGDPIYNTKLLPVIELGKACDMKAGKFKKAENIRNDFEENLYPCFGGNGIRGYVEDYTHEGSIPLIGRQGALCGNVQFATGKFYATEHAIVTQTKIGWNSLWLYIMLREMDLNRFASGAAQPGLNVSTLVTLEVINPEVELQNEYAEFVQIAYKLKFKIQKSLEKSQILFNSLMQEYFE